MESCSAVTVTAPSEPLGLHEEGQVLVFSSGTENWLALETKALTGREGAEYNEEMLSAEVMFEYQVPRENLFCVTQ